MGVVIVYLNRSSDRSTTVATMALQTLVARVSDGLPLTASIQDDEQVLVQRMPLIFVIVQLDD